MGYNGDCEYRYEKRGVQLGPLSDVAGVLGTKDKSTAPVWLVGVDLAACQLSCTLDGLLLHQWSDALEQGGARNRSDGAADKAGLRWPGMRVMCLAVLFP